MHVFTSVEEGLPHCEKHGIHAGSVAAAADQHAANAAESGVLQHAAASG